MKENELKSVAMFCDGLNALRDFCHGEAVARGFYDSPKEKGTSLMLIVSELGEALEADRKGRYADMVSYAEADATPEAFKAYVKDTVEDEMADTLIRILDFCGAEGIDIAGHVYEKLRYNQTRGVRHGKKY